MVHPRKSVVTLTDAERDALTAFTRKGTASVREVRRARVLLLAAAGEVDTQIAVAVGCSVATVARVRQRAATDGCQATLRDRPRPGGAPRLDDAMTAELIALACSDAPDGRTTWTMQLLADRLITLGVVGELSDETVRRTLKKTGSSPGNAGPGALVP